MNKLSIGRTRNNRTEKEITKTHFADIMLILGIAAMCVSLTVPMIDERYDVGDEAVAVMSTLSADENKPEREELVMPERDISANTEDSSIFEYIGEFFADLIRGGVS